MQEAYYAKIKYMKYHLDQLLLMSETEFCNYAKAPRIADRAEFKCTVNKYYCGELVGCKVEKMDMSALRSNKSKNSGCLNVLVNIVPFIAFYSIILIYQ